MGVINLTLCVTDEQQSKDGVFDEINIVSIEIKECRSVRLTGYISNLSFQQCFVY